MKNRSLRLRVGELLPWVDSSSRVRLPLDEFRVLAASAKESLAAARQRFVAWEFGVLRTSSNSIDVKPVLLDGSSEVDHTVAYPVGYNDAPLYRRQLAALWTEYLSWIERHFGRSIYLLSDEIWHETKGWIELAEAVSSGVVGERNLRLHATTRPGFLSGELTRAEIARLLERWWPSPFGAFGGVILRSNTGSETLERVSRSGTVSANDLPELVAIFETSHAFDNLGFVGLSLDDAWLEIEASLGQVGWHDGRALARDPL